MQLGLVGLGKMGFNMRERLREGGHEVIGYDPRPEVTDVPTLAALAEALTAPRVVWVMVPSGPITDATITSLAQELAEGDLVIDGVQLALHRRWSTRKNCWERRESRLSTPVSRAASWGLKEGYGLMVGGSDADVERAMPIFDTLRPPGPRKDGFVHAGPVGAGHYAKMVHNGIEYGLMTAYAEGYELLAAEDLIKDTQAVIQAWTNGTGGAVLAAAAAGQGAEGRSELRPDHRLHRRLRRRPVDGRGGHQPPRPDAGDRGFPVRPVRVATGRLTDDESRVGAA